MNLKNRIDKIEKTLNAGGGVKFEWIEPDENGEYPPATPGAKVITLQWDSQDAPPAEDRREPRRPLP